MTDAIDLIADEVGKHVDLILFEPAPDPTNTGVALKRDSGGLRCSCTRWEAPRSGGIRPHAEFRRHVAISILARLAAEHSGLPESVQPAVTRLRDHQAEANRE